MEVAPGARAGSSDRGSSVRTFLIADIRGYSTFTRERGDESAARLAMKFADLARDAVEARSGEVIGLRGDEVLAVFESAPQAVRTALEFQEACREASEEDPELPIPVGIGIDCGEAIPVEDGYRGKALNLAARLCSKAVAGQVLVTTDIADLAWDLAELEFESRGTAELKGFDQPVELFEASFAEEAPPVVPDSHPAEDALPPELDDAMPLVARVHEMRWLRGTWRQVRRGRGRILLVSGPAGIGKTRLLAELAAFAHANGAAVRYAGGGGAGAAEMVGAIAEARRATDPTLCVLDGLDVFDGAMDALAEATDEIESKRSLVVGLYRDAEGHPALTRLVDRVDVRGDGHRRLGPLGQDEVTDIARSYVGDVDGLPAESMLRASGGVPARLHEVIGEWARDEASRRLAAAAEWLAAGRGKQAEGLEFANNVIGLKLGQIYAAPATGDLAESCPYKGLAAFEATDASSFYGRERLVGELAARTVGIGLLGVVGPSGSGKSSVVMAGLLPSLAAGLLPGSDRWRRAILRPGEHPMDVLEAVLVSTDQGERLVLVVDQFEEVFTSVADESDRGAFIDRLVEIGSEPESAVVVLTIRGDYTDRCAQYPQLAELLASNLVLVGPMAPDELRRAIELPARRVGLRVESALVDALVEEVAEEPGGLPLLSTALVELWLARDGGWLRFESYERTGGVRGAVARLAEASFDRLEGEQREAARAVLLRLVGPGEGEAAVRRRVPLSEFDRTPAVEAVLTRFTDDRLLTAGEGTVEVAHEALIREWPRLRGWLEEDIQGREIRAHVTQAANQWADRDRDAAELYRGTRLSITLDWAGRHGRELNELEREFLATSREASEKEAEKQRRTNRRLRGLLVGTAVFLVVALVAGMLALAQRGHARDAQAAAEAQALRSDAERVGTLALTEQNPDRAMLFAVAGVQLQDLPETRGDLLSALQKTPALIRLIHASRNGATSLAISPDNRLLASGDSAGELHFNDLRTGEPSGAAVRLGEPISQQAVVFSPDGRSVAVATAAGGKARLHLIAVGSRTARWTKAWPSIPAAGGPLRFTHMAFSNDGTRIAVAVATAAATPEDPAAFFPVGERLFLLDAATGDVVWERRYPLGHALNEAYVEFTPEGVIVTSAQFGETLLWNARTGRIERRFPTGGFFALSPDGHLAAVALNNANPGDPSSSLAVLDLRTGKPRSLGPLPAKAWVIDLQFTPDGKSFVGAAQDSVVREWDVASGSIVQTFPGGINVTVSPDGRTMVSESASGAVGAWDLGGTQRLGQAFQWNDRNHGCPAAPCFVIDPQSTMMADDQGDGTVALIDLRTHRLVAQLPATNGGLADALAFFPDGRTLATGGVDGTVTLWDVGTRSPRQTLRFSDPVWWVAISPDGELLAVQTQAQDSPVSSVEVQDLSSGKTLFTKEVSNGRGGVAFSPDGRALAVLGCCQPDSTLQVWRARSGEELFTPRVGGHATSFAFSPKGGLLGAGTEDGKVVLWNASTGRQLGPPIQAAGGAVFALSFSPDGRRFAASSADATVWDIGSRKRIGDTFPLVQSVLPAAYFAPNGDLVIDYLANATQWPMDLPSWERFACQLAGRDLTRGEWTDVLPDRPYRHVCPQR